LQVGHLRLLKLLTHAGGGQWQVGHQRRERLRLRHPGCPRIRTTRRTKGSKTSPQRLTGWATLATFPPK
jgi:hypothetical protein